MLVAYSITKNTKQGGKDFWTRIGVCFVNRDGSMNLKLNALPIGGEIHIREEERQQPGRQQPTGAPAAHQVAEEFPDAF
jgi:hypothetical protein